MSGGQDGLRSVIRNGPGVWGDQEWAKKRPYFGNRRGSNGKGMGKPRREAGWRQGGARSSPAEGKKRARRGSRKGRGRPAIGGIRKQVGKWKWEPCGETVGEGWGVAVLRLAK